MSFRSLLKHRCTIMRADVDLDTGSPVYNWVDVKTNVMCRLDLNFVRMGKDQLWTPEAGRSTERSGVIFFLPTAPIKPGDWVKITKGPKGIFSLEAAVDEAWGQSDVHHFEIGAKEVPQQLALGAPGAPQPPVDATGQPVPVPALPPAGTPLDDIPGME